MRLCHSSCSRLIMIHTTLISSTAATSKYNNAPPPPKKPTEKRPNDKTQIRGSLEDLGKLLAPPLVVHLRAFAFVKRGASPHVSILLMIAQQSEVT
ncbi:hypothetical protein BYT27DRAFT_6675366 [Phlegmacium glaucopus]|nr:hypothetical protein BYT27DRAFT_6675366 [Phlegmacium glaucopus]